MDVQNTNLRRERLTTSSSHDSDVQLVADLAAIAHPDEAGSNRSTGETSNVPQVTDDAPQIVEPGDGRLYGQMTKPSPEAPEGSVTRLANYLTSTARKVSSGLAGSIRRDPWSAAMVGAGLAWVILQWWARKNVSTESSARKSNGAQSLGDAVSDSILTRLRSANETSGSHINGMTQRLADVAGARAQDFSQQAQQLGSQARERAQDLSGQIQDSVREMGDEAQDRVNDLRSNAQGQANRLNGDIQGTSQRLTESIEKALRPNLVSVSASLSRGIRPVTKPS